MRVYFLTNQRAALKLNGQYLGVIDGIERFVDIADGQEILAEVIPTGEELPYSFFIGQSLFEKPPSFLKVYLFGGDVQVYIPHFERRDRGLNILEQICLNDLSVTLFELGGRLYLSCDGDRCSLYRLPHYFEGCHLTEQSIGGLPVICAGGENCLCVISAEGKKLFLGLVESYSFGDMLGLTVNFKGCAGYFAERKYSYDGQELKLNKEVVKRRHDVEGEIRHFAFFEAVLYGGNLSEYLCEDMQGATDAIKEYLGDFKEVTVPRKAFYDRYGDISAAALAYPIKDNLFEIKYFSVEYMDGKIENIKAMP